MIKSDIFYLLVSHTYLILNLKSIHNTYGWIILLKYTAVIGDFSTWKWTLRRPIYHRYSFIQDCDNFLNKKNDRSKDHEKYKTWSWPCTWYQPNMSRHAFTCKTGGFRSLFNDVLSLMLSTQVCIFVYYLLLRWSVCLVFCLTLFTFDASFLLFVY